MATSGKSGQTDAGSSHGEGTSRRDFLYLAGGAFTAFGAAAAAWPLIDSLNPAADTLAASTVDVDLGPVQQGQAITVKYRGSPVFIRHRTKKEIDEAVAANNAPMPDPEPDAERVQKPQWLVMVGVCTHLGCIPLGQKPTDNKGLYGGWFCPCHGSHYDTSGRIRKGPAPLNLPIPDYAFVSDTRIRLGQKPADNAKKSA
jgi:ubiquinol-cytochrome c reductase iron-sulfur subunit